MKPSASVIGYLTILTLCIVLGACTQERSGSIRFGVAGAPSNFDPRYATDAASSRINRLIYQRLVDFNERAEPLPALAEWQVLAPLHYRFTLRPGNRTFHDGTRLTSTDVKATYDFVLDPANASPHRTALELIRRVDAVDDETIDFHLQRPDRLFPAYLAIGIVPSEKIESGAALNEMPVGSGALRFLGQPAPGRVVLERIDDRQRIEVVHVPDPTVRVLKLIRGEIDLLQNDLPAELIDWLKARPEVIVVQSNGTNYSYIGFNLDDPATGQLQVRQAVAHAIDREAIIQFVLGEKARVAGAIFPEEHWAGTTLGGKPYDPQKSVRLLAELGYSRDNPLPLTYKTSSDPLRVRLATVIQEQLGRVGFDISINSYDWGTFYGDIKSGRFQMYSLAWVGIHTPDIFRYVFHSNSIPPNGANRGRFRDSVADNLIETAEAETSNRTQITLYQQLQEYLAERLPYVSLWYEDHVYAARSGIEGYRIAPDGNYDGLETVYRMENSRIAGLH